MVADFITKIDEQIAIANDSGNADLVALLSQLKLDITTSNDYTKLVNALEVEQMRVELFDLGYAVNEQVYKDMLDSSMETKFFLFDLNKYRSEPMTASTLLEAHLKGIQYANWKKDEVKL